MRKKMCSFAGMKIFVMHDLRPVVHNNGAFFSFNGMEAMPFGVLPDSALLRERRPMFVPPFAERCSVQTHLAVRICRLGRCVSPRFAHRYYDAVTVGIDFTARDLQNKLRAEGKPWEISKGFDNSAVIGDFVSVSRFKDVQNLDFYLDIDGNKVQHGNTSDMIFKIDELIAYISQFYTLKIGDLLYTGTPVGVGPVSIGQHLEGYLEGEKLLDFYIR